MARTCWNGSARSAPTTATCSWRVYSTMPERGARSGSGIALRGRSASAWGHGFSSSRPGCRAVGTPWPGCAITRTGPRCSPWRRAVGCAPRGSSGATRRPRTPPLRRSSTQPTRPVERCPPERANRQSSPPRRPWPSARADAPRTQPRFACQSGRVRWGSCSRSEARRLDVLAVPLGALADAYLDALATLEGDRLGNISVFVAVASQLILIKSRAMLPRPPAPGVPLADEGADPEAELRARLLLYRAYRDAGAALQARALTGALLVRREPGVAADEKRAGQRP